MKTKTKKESQWKVKILAVGILVTGLTSVDQAQAGDREWSTAGKVLAGVAAGVIVADAIHDSRHHHHHSHRQYHSGVRIVTPPVVFEREVIVQRQVPPVQYYPAPQPAEIIYRKNMGREKGHHGRGYIKRQSVHHHPRELPPQVIIRNPSPPVYVKRRVMPPVVTHCPPPIYQEAPIIRYRSYGY